MQYETFDHVISLIFQFGRGALLAKPNIEEAFRIIPIHPSCYSLLGFMWGNQCVHNRSLPVGCAESCRIFERFSCALQWAAQHRTAAAVSHILDDFIFVGPQNSLNWLSDLNEVLIHSD